MSAPTMPHPPTPSGHKFKWKKVLVIASGIVASTAVITVAIVLGVKAGAKVASADSGRDGHNKSRGRKNKKGKAYDLILSSGFLAFAEHAGFLEAVEQTGVPVSGVMGTSAGALTGSLYCAGYTPREVAAVLSREAPYKSLSPAAPWDGGLLSFDNLVEQLRELLPPRFEDLQKEFAVGVVDNQGKHHLIDSGPLPEAVAASAAIPLLFKGVNIPGRESQNPFKDGGTVDRVGVNAWRDRRRAQLASKKGKQVPPALVHVIHRSSPFSGFDNTDATGETDISVFHSPKSGVSLLSLGDVEGTFNKELAKDKMQMQQLKLGSPRQRFWSMSFFGWSRAKQ